ncbi:MAG: pitrilysin family protein [Polyangiales bacterium]
MPLPHLQTVCVSLFVRAGSRHESLENNGVFHLLEHLLFRGTSAHPSTFAFNRALESLGGTLDGSTQVDLTRYDLEIPKENAVAAIHLIAEMVQTPLLQGLEIERKIIREEILEDLNDEGDDINPDNLIAKIDFGDHPLSLPIAGTLETIDSLDAERVLSDFERAYNAKNLSLVIAGSFVDPAIEETVRQAFGSLKAGAALLESTPVFPANGRYLHVHDSASQTEIRLSFRTGGRHDSTSLPLRLAERILDDGLSTRLYQAVCDQRGLAYDTYCGLDTYSDCGAFGFGAAVEHRNAAELVRTWLSVLDDLRTNPIGEDELKKAKRRIGWDARSAIDSAIAMTDVFGASVLFDELTDMEHDLALYDAVDAAILQSTVQKFFQPSIASLVTVGVLNDRAQNEIENLLR